MKKIIFMLSLTTSGMLLAKNEGPIKKTEFKKETKTILIVKKTIEEVSQKQKPIRISTTEKQEELTSEEKCIIELALGPVIAGPPYHCTQI